MVLSPKYVSSNDIAAILVTHMFGAPFNIEHIVKYSQKHSIPLFEDAVQGGYITSYIGHSKSTVIVFSGGHDKMPISFGGGFSVCRDKEIFEGMKKINSKYRLQTWWERCYFLIQKLLSYGTNNSRQFMRIVIYFGFLCGYSKAYEWGLYFRKNIYAGFLHARMKYMYKPSVYELMSMEYALSMKCKRRYAKLQKECQRRRSFLMKELGEKKMLSLFPWGKNLEIMKTSNFYFHIYVNDTIKACDEIDKIGMMGCPSASWYCDEKCATHNFWKRLVILPHHMILSKKEMEKLAICLKNL